MNKDYLTVTQLTKYIKYRLDNDSNLQEVYLKGEISNFKAHTRGHFYFTIKDEGSRINAVMFASSAKNVKFSPENGMKVLVTGRISVYEANGGYQIYVQEMMEDGVGNLYVAFEQLKKKLGEAGMFDEAHKKKIPRIPSKIGVITAPTGAAIRDIISTINRRFPLANMYLFPSLVQGEDAKYNIVKQIEEASKYPLDVLIVGRGGGSIEDLWAFNEEIVAHAIYNCPIPIISAVGHEIDFTIADFVADLRALTPTGAAELAVPNRVDVISYINQLMIRGKKRVEGIYQFKKQKLEELTNSYILKNPLTLYSAKEQKLDYLIDQVEKNMQLVLKNKKHEMEKIKTSKIFVEPELILNKKIQKYELLLTKLDTLSPLKTLKRGYTIIKKEDVAITSKKDVKKGDSLEVNFQDGNIFVEVK